MSTYYRAGMNTGHGQYQPLRLASEWGNMWSFCPSAVMLRNTGDSWNRGRGHDWWEAADQTVFLPTQALL